MSVDCKLYLPVDVSARDLEEAIAILLGAKATYQKFNGHDFYTTEVEGQPRAEACKYVEGVSNFKLPGKDIMPLRPSGFDPTFHYIARRGRTVYNLLKMSSSPTRVALAIRLAKFFGGIVDYNDCDENGKELRFKRTLNVSMLADMDNEPFGRFQLALSKLQPLTKDEIRAAGKFAAWSYADEQKD